MALRLLGEGAAGTVYGFSGLAFKVQRQGYEGLAKERDVQARIYDAWAVKGRQIQVCFVVSFHSSVRQASMKYNLPQGIEGENVLVMNEIPAFSPETWYKVVPEEYEPGILRLYLGEKEAVIDTYPELNEEQRRKIHKWRKPAIGWEKARDVLGVDISILAFELGVFMAFLLYELGLDGGDVELQLGDGVCQFVVDFSLVMEFGDVETVAKGLAVNEKFFPVYAQVGDEAYPLWTDFCNGYKMDASRDEDLRVRLKLLDKLGEFNQVC